jgi:hypothetical protein
MYPLDTTCKVPGADGRVKLVFTAIDKDDLSNDFLGQAIIDTKGSGLWRTGSYRLPV